MPPQQSDGLLDRLDERFGFGAHQRLLNQVAVGIEARQLEAPGVEGKEN
jgi:hypothetical protein